MLTDTLGVGAEEQGFRVILGYTVHEASLCFLRLCLKRGGARWCLGGGREWVGLS